MAASTTLAAPINSSNALFRAWGSLLDAALLAAGWVKASDTGQIDWTTVAAPAGTNTSQGYSIWRTNSGLAHWYVKFEYGSAAAINTPSIWITVGSGTNGSGTLTGQLGTRQQIFPASSSVTTYSCHFAGDVDWFSCGMFSQAASSTFFGFCFCLEPTRDSTGAATADGFCMYGNPYNSAFNQVIPASGSAWTIDAFVPGAWSRAATNISGTTCGVIPVLPLGQFHYPAALGAVGYYYADIAVNTTFTLSRYGSNRTYIAFRPSNSIAPGSFGIGGPASYSLALRYE